MRYLYTILFCFALPFILLRLWWRSRRLPAYRLRLAERFGLCPHHFPKSIWVHAVSVGEVIAAVPLIKALKSSYPDIPFVVTTTTPTGAERVTAALKDDVSHVYIPYDVPLFFSIFLKRVQPVICVVMETELWPNLFAACHQRKIPIIIANARLSARSAKGYQRFGMKSLRQNMWDAVYGLAAQSHLDAERFHSLGLSKNKIVITGNLKFDLELPINLSQESEELHKILGKDRFLWIAASTHPGEEEIILKAAQQIHEKQTSALLILVPRHPDRFDGVATLLEQQGWIFARRSRHEICSAATQVYLADTMGELLLMYSVVDVAFVAGSLISVGGHNMLEPAVLQKPIITGPVLFNFAEISQWLMDAHGMVIAKNADEISEEVIRLFLNDPDRKKMGENAYQVVSNNRGALHKQLELVKKYIK